MRTSLEVLLGIGNNREHLEGLVRQLRNGPGLTPFIGAGISAQLNLLGWGDFLISIARLYYAEQQVSKLVADGKYEEAAEVCIQNGGPGGLQHAITEEFGDRKLEQVERFGGALRLIPELANGPVVTANFDHVLERAFRKARKDFQSVLWGARAGAMIEAFQRNRRCLFKIHGDVDDPEQRILTRQEYDFNPARANADLVSLW